MLQKSKILIASGSRTEVLAEKLRDQLETNYSVAELWKDAIKGKPTETTIEMLEWATEKYDFAVIILDETAMNVSTEGGPLKDRDNLFLEAGFFIAALGRECCFIVNSAERHYLPSDLDGIKPLRFIEPEPDKLRDRDACTDAIRNVGSQILDAVEREKKPKNRPLSKETLMDREKPHPTGELEEGHVVVTVTQPLEIGYAAARQVRENMNGGIAYAYYFHGDPTRVPRICQLLQMVLLAPMLADEREAEYKCRLSKLLRPETQAQIIADLKFTCEEQLLKIFLLKDPPELQYVIHNATSDTDAILYLKHKDKFIEWERGEPAYKIWEERRKSLGVCAVPSNAVFCGTSGFNVKEDPFYGTLKIEMRRSFPGIDEKVIELCCDGIPSLKV